MWRRQLGVVARGQPYTDADPSNLIAGLERSGLEVHGVSWAEGASEVLGYDVAPSAVAAGPPRCDRSLTAGVVDLAAQRWAS